ncbi:MAG: hypothetical protein PHU25_19900 [Deltaproteobacteria bacterium]|nr:hypothetical protein [Deltaproteobacteria bacterium]
MARTNSRLVEAALSAVRGEARTERVRCTCPRGHRFSASIQLCIGNASDSRALEAFDSDGTQRVQCPVCAEACRVAEPVLIHDVAGSRFAILVPQMLGHLEIELRASLLEALATADPDLVPQYVVDFEILLGGGALATWRKPPAEPDDDESPEVSSVPPRPDARYAQVPDPALSLPTEVGAKDIHEAFADLARPVTATPSMPPEPFDGDEPQEDVESLFADEGEDDSWLPKKDFGGDDDKTPVPEPEPKHSPVPERSKTPARRTPAVAAAPILERPSESDFSDLLADDDIVEEHEAPSRNDEPETLDDDDLVAEESDEKRNPLAPKPMIDGARSHFEVAYDRVVLHCVISGADPVEIDPDRADLWFQLHFANGFPLVALTLVFDPKSRHPRSLSWLLDVTKESHREVAHALRRKYRAEIRLYDENLAELKRFTVGGERELNISIVMDRAAKAMADLPPEHRSFEEAAQTFASEPEPLGRVRPPFQSDNQPSPENFEDGWLLLELVHGWLAPERYDYLVLTRSFPLDQFQEVVSEALRHAVRFGIRVQGSLMDRCVALGLATDRKDLVRALVAAFDDLVRRGEGPDDEAEAQNWSELFTDAKAVGAEIDPDVRDRAELTLERLGLLGEEIESWRTALERPDQVATDTLATMLRHRSLRRAALEALAARGEPSTFSALLDGFSRLEPAALPQAVRAVAALGEALADGLVTLLGSPRTHVRQAAAVLLGATSLRRTVTPLIQGLLTEPTPLWLDLARAVAVSGSMALKPLERHLIDEEADEGRLATVLALILRRDKTAADKLAAMEEAGDARTKVIAEKAQRASELPPTSAAFEAYGDLLRRAVGGERIEEEDASRAWIACEAAEGA